MKKFLPYTGLIGWLLVAIFSLKIYPSYFRDDCYFESSWIFCAAQASGVMKALSILLITVFVGSLIVSGYALWKKYEARELANKPLIFLAITYIFLAIITVPFGSSDTSYYFSAGASAHGGLNPYVDDWMLDKSFVGSDVVSKIYGFSYGPIMLTFFKWLYEVSFHNAAIFVTIWKLFLAAVLVCVGWATHRLLQAQEIKIVRASFLIFWLSQPLLLFEVLVNGHFDVLWLLFILLAIRAAIHKRWWIVIPALIIGIWIKFLPLLVAPFFALWWWQETTRFTWKKQLSQAIFGCLLGAGITIISWHGLWQGFKVFNLIALQSKWAVDSAFSVIYYSLKPIFAWMFHDRAHWVLTRSVQGGLVLLVGYLLWPYIKKIFLVLLKKYSLTPEQYIKMMFFSFFVYLSLWQKSFWPWYAAWIIPLGILAYEQSRNVLLGRILVWISLVPLSFYPLWLLNWYVRNTDAVPELWFQQLFVTLVWGYPLYLLFKLRKDNFGFSDKEDTSTHPFAFILRQLYRLIFAWPFQFFVSVVGMFNFNVLGKHAEKAQYCFIISSVIFPKQKELSYTDTRSVYNPAERAAQTLKTIESIKEKVPEAKIVLVEAGLQEDLPLDLAKKVDQYIYLGNRRVVRMACDSKFKSLGEAIMFICAGKRIKFDAETYFKISGRYFLDENFKVNDWQGGLFRFFYIRESYVSTRLYSFSRNMMGKWRLALIKGLPLLLLDYPIEHILPRFIAKKYIVPVDKAGVMGADATTGKIIKE